MYEDFAPERIAQLRTRKDVSARDMALSLGQANNYINNIENKKSLSAMQPLFLMFKIDRCLFRYFHQDAFPK